MIYAIQAGDGGPIKFGVAHSPSRRLQELQTGCPQRLKLIAYADVHKSLEKLIHRYCREANIGGEWFSPTSKVMEMVEVIKRQAFFHDEHVIGNYIYEKDIDTVIWERRRLGMRQRFDDDNTYRTERLDMMKDIVERDPLVKDLMTTLGATVVTESIKPTSA